MSAPFQSCDRCVTEQRSTDTTPLLDPLRTTHLHPPYYGVRALENTHKTTAMYALDGRSQLLAQVREKELELQSMYALLNAGAPINQLPIELLVEIFARFQNVDTSSHYWTNVLRVCRHWFVVGSTAGKLWKNLRVRNSLNMLRTGLARSMAAEFSVYIFSTHTGLLPDVSSFLIPHLHRMRNLRLGRVSPTDGPALVKFMDSAMPTLHRLYACVDSNAHELALDFSLERFPRLEELEVSHMHVFGNLALFSQLRIVKITGCFCSAPKLKTATLLDALRRMENIEELSLSNLQVCDLGTSSPFTGMGNVALSKLQSLTIDAKGPLVKQMLSGIAIPHDATVCINFPLALWGETPAEEMTSLAAVLPEDRRSLPVLARIVEAHIVATSAEHRIIGYTTTPFPNTGGPAPLVLILELPDDVVGSDINIAPEDLVDVLCDSPLESVTIEISSSEVAQVDWRAFFTTNPTLRRLDLTVSECNLVVSADVIFSALDPGDVAIPTAEQDADPGAGGNTAPTGAPDSVLCPHLRSVHLYGLSATPDTLLDTVATCLENRRRKLGKPSEYALVDLVLGLVDHSDQLGFVEAKDAFTARIAPLVRLFNFHSTRDL